MKGESKTNNSAKDPKKTGPNPKKTDTAGEWLYF